MLTTVDELVPLVEKKQFIVVEGARCSGKNTLINELCTHLPEALKYEYLYPRKNYTDERGSVKIPADLDVQQSSFWVMDFLRQVPDIQVISNRSMLSSLFWDRFHDARFSVWKQALASVNGIVVMVQPKLSDQRRFLQQEHRSHELTSVIRERTALTSFAHEIPEELVVWYENPLRSRLKQSAP